MTPEEIERLVKKHGGRIVGQIPDFGKGAIAAAQHAAFYRERMHDLRASGGSASEGQPLAVAVSGATVKVLEEIAEQTSSPEDPKSAADVAADILNLAALKRVDEIHRLVTERRKTG